MTTSPLQQGELKLGRKFSREHLAQSAIRKRIEARQRSFPEALPVRYKKQGSVYILDRMGRPQPLSIHYHLFQTSLSKESGRRIRGSERRKEVIAEAYTERLMTEFDRVSSDPRIMAGQSWYRIARSKIKSHFGDDSLLFAQLLAATSARTGAAENYRQAIEAYNLWKLGHYDGIAEQYIKLRELLKTGGLRFRKTWNSNAAGSVVTGKTFREYLDSEGIIPRRANGKKYSANSLQVLRVIAGVWEEEVGGPKTPNFARNLSGAGLEATIDIWMARFLRRMGCEGMDKQWRILPECEVAVSNADFALGQLVFRKASVKTGINPDELQAIFWFAEKDTWTKRGWTNSHGSEMADFGRMLDRTRTEDGRKILDVSNQLRLF